MVIMATLSKRQGCMVMGVLSLALVSVFGLLVASLWAFLLSLPSWFPLASGGRCRPLMFGAGARVDILPGGGGHALGSRGLNVVAVGF